MSATSAISAASQDGLLDELLTRLAERSREDGTVRAQPDETEASVEATVWRALALRLAGPAAAKRARAAGEAIARLQAEDGRVSFSQAHPGAYSPTMIAILAWHGQSALAGARERAVAFLLAQKSDHYPRSRASDISIDTDLAGWSWIERTFAWAEPTALALLALESAGAGEHPRAVEGRALLLNRQIASGGWNYGNARVFDAELRPAQESTGLVLAALAGRVPATAVTASLAYLEAVAPALRTPLALGWACLAQNAWRAQSATRDAGSAASAGIARQRQVLAIRETLARESRYGSYDSAELALLAVALCSPRGLLAALRESA